MAQPDRLEGAPDAAVGVDGVERQLQPAAVSQRVAASKAAAEKRTAKASRQMSVPSSVEPTSDSAVQRPQIGASSTVVQRPSRASSTVLQKPRKPWRAQLNISVCRRSLQFDRMHEPQRL